MTDSSTRIWQHTSNCCCPIGHQVEFPAEEPLIVCGHAVPLKPVSILTPEFLGLHEEVKQAHLDDIARLKRAR